MTKSKPYDQVQAFQEIQWGADVKTLTFHDVWWLIRSVLVLNDAQRGKGNGDLEERPPEKHFWLLVEEVVECWKAIERRDRINVAEELSDLLIRIVRFFAWGKEVDYGRFGLISVLEHTYKNLKVRVDHLESLTMAEFDNDMVQRLIPEKPRHREMNRHELFRQFISEAVGLSETCKREYFAAYNFELSAYNLFFTFICLAHSQGLTVSDVVRVFLAKQHIRAEINGKDPRREREEIAKVLPS